MALQRTLIFIKPADSSFIRSDQQMLGQHFTVVPFLLKQSGAKWKYLLSLVQLKLFLIWKGLRASAFVCWFGDYHAAVMVLIAKLLRKKSVIIAGGQEAICYHELGKGVYRKRLRGAFVRYALRNASLILPNHASLMYHENTFYNSENPHIDGINHYAGKLKGRVEVVPNGIDSARINRDPAISKEADLVLTIGTMHTKADFYNKGFDLFIQLAAMHAEKRFVMIGMKKSDLGWMEEEYKAASIPNLTVIPSFCPDKILNEMLNKAKVYLQISITEGMPVSLGEAMLCECIPVGSNVNGIPDAIGDTGIIVKRRDINELSKALLLAFSMNTGDRARQRVLEKFSLDQRGQKLARAINSLFK